MNKQFDALNDKINAMLLETNTTEQIKNVSFLIEKDIFSEMNVERTANNALKYGRFLKTTDYKTIVNDAIDFINQAEPCHICGEPAHYLDNDMLSICVKHTS